MSEAAQRREKQEWSSEKPKLDNASKLRGIFFFDPEDAYEDFRLQAIDRTHARFLLCVAQELTRFKVSESA